MPRRVSQSHPTAPASRVADQGDLDGYFYAGEAAKILKLDHIDYSQIRTLFRFVREQAGVPVSDVDRRWSRFTLTDLTCMEALVDLCGGRAALGRGRRLRLKPVRRACEWLRAQGISNPLLQIPMSRTGDQVFVLVDGAMVQPGTGQVVLTNMIEIVRDYVRDELETDDRLSAAITAELNARTAAPPSLKGSGMRIT